MELLYFSKGFVGGGNFHSFMNKRADLKMKQYFIHRVQTFLELGLYSTIFNRESEIVIKQMSNKEPSMESIVCIENVNSKPPKEQVPPEKILLALVALKRTFLFTFYNLALAFVCYFLEI